MNDLNPALASRLLRENSQEINDIAEKIIEKRNEYAIKEAEHMDIKAESSVKRLSEMNVTTAKTWIDIDCKDAKKAMLRAEYELKNLQDRRDVLINSNNNLKIQIKFAETEIRNLNL